MYLACWADYDDDGHASGQALRLRLSSPYPMYDYPVRRAGDRPAAAAAAGCPIVLFSSRGSVISFYNRFVNVSQFEPEPKLRRRRNIYFFKKVLLGFSGFICS